MEIRESRQGKVAVLSPSGRIDNDTSPDFQARLLGLIAPGVAVVVDFAKVDYISSAGLRALMTASKQSKAAQGRIAVAALQPVVQEIFAISRFAYVVKVFDRVPDAVAAVS